MVLERMQTKGYFPIMGTPWGNMGSLICWKSYMPLARVALYEKGVTIYISPNTNDNPEWQATIQHIALEGHCYFINADMYFTKDMYPKDLHCQDEIDKLSHIVCRGGSCIVDPYGHYVTEPVWDKERNNICRFRYAKGSNVSYGIRSLWSLCKT
ncbi:MAG: nitrilase-related carbon-nitrogen hydrolase [Thomasclavelia sp.]